MAKGTIAKENVIKIIKQAFGKDFITEIDKKLYVWQDDGGSRVQIAISLTCPKNEVEVQTDWEFGEESTTNSTSQDNSITTPPPLAEVTQEETELLEDLLKKFGL